MNSQKKAGIALAGVAAAALAGFGVVAATNAEAETPNAAPSATATTNADQTGQRGPQQGTKGDRSPGGQSQDTPVTGEEAQKVIDAVKAKDASVTISDVRKDPDGSYDALGTKSDGTKVMYDVSADLATITEHAGKGGPGGPGGQSQDTPVTGDEAQKVKDAVKAKDSSVTVSEVRKDPDGSYDALGTTSDGSKVMYDVSADLKTVTQGGGGR